MSKTTEPTAGEKKLALDRAAYKSLLGILENGRPVWDPRTGQQSQDNRGKLIFTPATASDIATAGTVVLNAVKLDSAVGVGLVRLRDEVLVVVHHYESALFPSVQREGSSRKVNGQAVYCLNGSYSVIRCNSSSDSCPSSFVPSVVVG